VIAVGNRGSFWIQSFNQGTYKLEGLETVFDDSNHCNLDFEGIKAYEIMRLRSKKNPWSRITPYQSATAAEENMQS